MEQGENYWFILLNQNCRDEILNRYMYLYREII